MVDHFSSLNAKGALLRGSNTNFMKPGQGIKSAMKGKSLVVSIPIHPELVSNFLIRIDQIPLITNGVPNVPWF